MKTILVAGGAGYIGSHMVALLVEKGYDVVVVDNLCTGHWQAVKGAKLRVGDLRDGNFLDQVFSEFPIDGVINFAAYSLVGESVTNPLKYYGNNVAGSQSMLTAMKNHGVKKIVFSSTAATYGEPEKQPIEETDRTEPTNPYGATKLAIEGMLKWCDRAYGIKYAALRYFNAAGANTEVGIGEDHNPESHLIPIVLQAALGKRDHVGIWTRAARAVPSTWATAPATPSRRSSTPPGRSPARLSPPPWSPAGPAIPPSSSPPTRRPRRFWAGSRSAAWSRSSPTPGPGTAAIPTATANKNPFRTPPLMGGGVYILSDSTNI